MNSTPTNTKKKLNAMDWFIIIAVLLCIAGAALRAFIGTDNALNGTVTMEKHVVFFKVENIRNSSTEYLAPGAAFYIDVTGQYLGEISGNVTVTPAVYMFEDANGKYVQAYAPENGDATRVDATGTLIVDGYMSDNGFLLNGTTSLAPGKEITIRSNFIQVKITVTEIVKAS